MEVTSLTNAIATSTDFASDVLPIVLDNVLTILALAFGTGIGVAFIYWGVRKVLGAAKGKV